MARYFRHIWVRLPLVLMLAVSIGVPAAARGGSHAAAAGGTTVNMNGQVANASFSFRYNTPSASTPNIDVFVSQSGTAGNRQTFLGYEVYYFVVHPDGYWEFVPIETGYGPVPSSALSVTGGARPSSIALKVDTSALSATTFYRTGAGGLISLQWTSTQMYTNTWAGNSRGTFGDAGHFISWTSAGSGYNTSAAAQGSLVGYSVPSATADWSGGNMGSWQGVQLCRGCGPPPAP